MGHGGFKPQVQQRIIKSRHELSGGEPWKKMENKERFPLSHGTATAIYMNLFPIFVALGL